MTRRAVALVAALVVGVGAAGAVVVGGALGTGNHGPAVSVAPSGVAVVTPSTGSGADASPVPASEDPGASPTPAPTPVLVPAPMDGLLVSPADARRHPIAVMIDDLYAARPQAGFTDASVVWQAPAEGGIPRYMLIFQERTPKDVGPVRSARYYYIAWAAEWRAMYVHAGGSPQALQTLRQQGAGQLVYNADQFFNGAYFRRVTNRFPPHNLFTTGAQLHQLTARLGATKPAQPATWQFGPDAPLESRPAGGRIEVDYQANVIVYKYERATNTYPRFVSGTTRQVDAGSKKPVAPKNVVIMLMQFGPLNDGEAYKHRLEAKIIGSGTAWIATNGHTIKGTWRKKSLLGPTLFYDATGHQVTLTAGQTFIQVMKPTDLVKIKDGKPPPSPSPSPAPGASPGASPSAQRCSGAVAA
jgi:hypothetical protein